MTMSSPPHVGAQTNAALDVLKLNEKPPKNQVKEEIGKTNSRDSSRKFHV